MTNVSMKEKKGPNHYLSMIVISPLDIYYEMP